MSAGGDPVVERQSWVLTAWLPAGFLLLVFRSLTYRKRCAAAGILAYCCLGKVSRQHEREVGRSG